MLHLRELRLICCMALFRETERLWENCLIAKTAFLQLSHQMGPDPVPETHRGVELIIRSLARMAGRQHSKKHSQNTVIA